MQIWEDFRCGVCDGRSVSGAYDVSKARGAGKQFHYLQCKQCGSLWLAALPIDLGAYYPGTYYSFSRGLGWIARRLRKERDSVYFGKGNVLGRFLARNFREDGTLLPVSKLDMPRKARILDVGCGSGKLLQRMAAMGFSNLWGVDPFVRKDLNGGPLPSIRKCRIQDLSGEAYDLIMFHHSLEHVTEPKDTLWSVVKLLAPGGRCLVRLPIVSYAWQRYQTDWVQLDPPRHVWLPTEHAMRQLASSVGLRVDMVEYDSTEFQFWGSELCRRGLWSGPVHPRRVRRHFTSRDWQRFRSDAAELNRKGLGDQACFYLSRM